MNVVHLQVDSGIAQITLDHPANNRINFPMRQELLEAIEQVATSDARVLVIKAAGENFSLGGDARDWPGVSVAELRPKIEVFAKAVDRLQELEIPTIASVQGGCMGGGFELALGCDLIVAGRSARFAFPESLAGILTLQGGVYNLAERIGRTKAIELAFLSEPVSAEQMAQWNVINRVVEDHALAQETEALAHRLASGPAMAYAATKDLLRIWQREGIHGARKALYDLSMPLFETDDVQQALRGAADAMSTGKPFPKAVFSAGPKMQPVAPSKNREQPRS
jgi:enoyl-CoA hydratase/carnithine racemase